MSTSNDWWESARSDSNRRSNTRRSPAADSKQEAHRGQPFVVLVTVISSHGLDPTGSEPTYLRLQIVSGIVVSTSNFGPVASLMTDE